jgi:hypothetical protein
MRSSSIRVCRVISVARALLALGLLVRPDRIATLASFGGRLPAAWLIRLLGGRLLAQSGLELARASGPVVRFGAAVDALHAASMVAIALRRPRYRQVALASAAVAAASAVAGLTAIGRQR